MLAALLAGKLERELKRSPTDIEDLLTSVVFGACRYVPPRDALLPFLGRARNAQGAKLAPMLAEVSRASYHFWPSWTDEPRVTPSLPPDHRSRANPHPQEAVGVHNHEPELVLALARPGLPAAWVLIEAKLLSGKSSRPSPSGPVNDQLGRYWVQLQRRAEAAHAIPLAVVYVTRGVTLPEQDFQETQGELAKKQPNAAPAPLYWVSWRDFVGAVNTREAILHDTCLLLRERWQLVHAEMTGWPARPASLAEGHQGAGWTFTRSWRWLQAPATTIEWSYSAETQRA